MVLSSRHWGYKMDLFGRFQILKKLDFCFNKNHNNLNNKKIQIKKRMVPRAGIEPTTT